MVFEKKLLIGITGSIASYKITDLLSILKENQYKINIKIILTKDALNFVSIFVLKSIIGSKNVYVDTDIINNPMLHIRLAKWADSFIIFACTANTISKIVAGIADNLLLNITLVYKGRLVIIPAMNPQMWSNKLITKNIYALKRMGIRIWGPLYGKVTCGDIGYGKMLGVNQIKERIIKIFSPKILKNIKVVVTNGPTIEPIDAIRYLTNYSSGKMGNSIAEVAYYLGADVYVISGPTNIDYNKDITVIKVKTAKEMLLKTLEVVSDNTDFFISAAAVADVRVNDIDDNKIKKEYLISNSINFIKNVDILKAIATSKNRPFCIGFAAETNNVINNAIKKICNKKLDMIIANKVGENKGFNVNSNEVTLITKDYIKNFPEKDKKDLAFNIWEEIIKYYDFKNYFLP